MKSAIKALEEMGYTDIVKEMSDAHAQYFAGKWKGEPRELKVVHADEEGDCLIASRGVGEEDWDDVYYYNVNEE